MSKEELKPIDVSKYTVTESGNVIKSEEKETTKEDFFRQNFPEYCVGDTFLSPYWDLFEAGYELKQNILSQHILELQADKGELTDRVKELEQENAELKEKLTAIRNAKDKYDMSKNKSIIKAFGAEYTLFCDLERILEDWQEDDNLTKAKEIIKKLLSRLNRLTYTGLNCEECKEAEQFLKLS